MSNPGDTAYGSTTNSAYIEGMMHDVKIPVTVDTSGLMNLYRRMNALMRDGDFAAVNEELASDPRERPTLLIVGLLRITWPARKHLSNWRDARDRAKQLLRKRKVPVATLMRGLLEY